MDRRAFVVGTGAVLLATPYIAEAQPVQRVARVGYLSDIEAGSDQFQQVLEEGLRKHGYISGTNLLLEKRFAERRPERLAGLAAELVRLRMDVIVAASERGAVAVKQATTAIPIVMVFGIDPVGLGLIDTLARPGGNVTGLTLDPGPEIIAKRLQLLREIAPGARIIALLTEPGGRTLRFGPLEEAARTRNVSIVKIEVRQFEDLPSAFTAITKARAGAILVSGAAMLYGSRREVSEQVLKHRLPAIYPLRDYAEAGGLISYGVDLLDLFRRAATYIDKILKGAKPADLPVEQPTKFELVINLKTAKALGLTIPPSLLGRADEIIK
jgi:putative ABC transport system substrate-binding protein